jgi:hypothetical protein
MSETNIRKLQAIVPESLKTWYKIRAASTGETLNAIVLEALTQYQSSIGEHSTQSPTSNWRQLLSE